MKHYGYPQHGYLQHGQGAQGPFRTERVEVTASIPMGWLARFEGRWRVVHFTAKRAFIVYRGERITIQIERVTP